MAVKAALTEHFGKKTDTLQAHAELGRAMQQPGESVESFASSVRRIGKLAYPGVAGGDKTVEESITSRFICGLRDEWVQRKLYRRAPTTLKEAVKVFKELRSQQEAVQAVRGAQTHVPSVAVAAGAFHDRSTKP